ncbi:MAG: TolC family protein [Bacteroidia bacterium]|nr:TolC family protein [Bacteroidia bacterium]
MNMYSYTNLTKLLSLTVLLFLYPGIEVSAQTPITLEQAIEMARQSNRSIQLADQTTAIKRATLEQSKAHFLPYFGVQLTDLATNNPLNVFGFKLMQEDVKQSDFAPDLLNDPDVRNNFNLSLNAMMTLYNPEARAEQDAVKAQIKMSEAMAHRVADGIQLEVIKAYYALLLTQHTVEVLENTYAASQANYEIVDNYFNQGLMLKSDLLDMQIMVNQSELSLGTAQMKVANAQSYFNHILNTSEYTEYLPTDELRDKEELLIAEGNLNPERADFKAMQYGISALENMAEAADKSNRPKLNVFSSYALNDEIPFDNRATNFQIGLSVGWDIYKGNLRKSTLQKTNAEINEQQLALEQKLAEAELEILNTQRAIEDINSQIELHELSIEQAEEALKIRKNRFAQGLEKSTDIINAETQLSHKKLARLSSLFELNMKNAYLKFLLN